MKSALATTALILAGALAAPQARSAEAELALQELPTQKLAPGQCALVLWTRTAPARRVFMAVTEPAGARLQSAGRTVELLRTASSGEAVYGHFPEETFAGGGWEVKATVSFDTKGALVGGALAPSGSLEVRDARGWTTVVPVAGMVACQS